MGTLIGSTFRNALAIRYNGTTQYSYRDNPSWKGDTSGTISLWITPSATLIGPDSTITFISMGVNDAGNNSFFSIRQRCRTAIHPTNNYVSIIHRATHAAATNQVIFTTTPLVAGTRYHVTVSSDGSAWFCEVNGVSQAVTVIVGSNNGDWFGDVSGVSHRATLGVIWVANATGAFWAGDIDEVNYFDLLNPAERLVLYNGGTPGNPYRLNLNPARWKTWLRCGDSRDTAATMFDEVGTDDFTNVNSPSYVAA